MDKMQGVPSICLFWNKFNKVNNTGALMLDSIHHMISKLIKNHIFGLKFTKQLEEKRSNARLA